MILWFNPWILSCIFDSQGEKSNTDKTESLKRDHLKVVSYFTNRV